MTTDPGDDVLATFPVLARLRSTGLDEAAALADAREQLVPLAGMYDDVAVERREDDGSFWVVARFVTVSVDAHTAVLGVHGALADAAVPVDEIWVASSAR